MKNFRTRFPLALAFCFVAAPTFAQYTGPGARKDSRPTVARSVAEVLQDAKDDRPVQLTGTLVEQTGKEKFLFRDATGEITVEIDADDFPANQPIGPDVQVTLTGEIETRLMRKPEVEVETIQLATTPPTP